MYVSSSSRTRQAPLSFMASSFCVWRKWSSHSMYHLTQALPQELWMTEYTSRASTLRVSMWKLWDCVCFQCVTAWLQRSRAVRKRNRGEVINEYLIGSSPCWCAVILMWSRGLEAGSLRLTGTLAHCSHMWALPDLPVETNSVVWMTICLCICPRTCLGIYIKVKVSTDWQVETHLQQRYKATLIIWWWMSDNCW